MGLSIGIDYTLESWKTCLMENGKPIELRTFADSAALFASIEHTCALYPEPFIGVAANSGAALAPLHDLSAQQLADLSLVQGDEAPRAAFQEFLIALKALNFHSYRLPAARHLSTIPAYRKWIRRDFGSARALCRVVALLQSLRERTMTWPEMHFLCLEAHAHSWSILVIENGQVVDGIGESEGNLARSSLVSAEGGKESVALAADESSELEQAFWEALQQDLAAMMAVHHCEDIVVAGQRQEEFAAHLGELYQLYLFPRAQGQPDGFECALGAALIADGLHHPNVAMEVVERLLGV